MIWYQSTRYFNTMSEISGIEECSSIDTSHHTSIFNLTHPLNTNIFNIFNWIYIKFDVYVIMYIMHIIKYRYSTQYHQYWFPNFVSKWQLLVSPTTIINHMFRKHKCACTNITVGVAVNLQRKMNAQLMNKGSNLFPSPN